MVFVFFLFEGERGEFETAGAFPPNPFGNVYQKYPKSFRSIHNMFTVNLSPAAFSMICFHHFG